MASEAVRRRRSLWVIGAVLAGWLVLQQLLHPPTPEPRFCGRDVEPGADTVVMLSASWCGYCRRARTWLVAEGIEYCEYDVEAHAEGREQFAALPHKVVPVLKIRGDILVGFNPIEITQTLAAHGITEFDD
ncbi:MAG: glutaredoxin family protein [Gammaproteobacteria bacterium]